MSFPYPAKPWTDGQKVTVPLNNRYVMAGTYYAAKNVWSFVRTATEGGDVDASTVVTSDLANPGQVTDQQSVNAFLFEEIKRLRTQLGIY